MNESIGAKLRLAREGRRLTLEQVSEATRIRAHYVQALESDDLSGMPSAAQARGFLRIYGEYLGLGMDELVPPAPLAVEEVPSAAVTEPAGQQKTSARAVFDQLLSRFKRNAPGQAAETTSDATADAAAIDQPASAAAPAPSPAASIQTAEPPEAKKKVSS